MAEFKVGRLARVRVFVLTSVAVVAGMGIALGCLSCLIFGDSPMRTWLGLSGAVTAVLLYFRLRERTRLRRAQAHLMAYLAHLFSVGPAYLYMSLTGWRRARQIRGLRVLVYPEGLVRIQANEVDVVRWEEITIVRRAILWQEDLEAFFYGRVRLSLETTDGRRYEFDDGLFRLTELRKLIEQHTLPHLLDRALNAYEAGCEVSFGALRALRSGLMYGNRYLSWADYEGIETRKGFVHVKTLAAKRAIWKLYLLQVPNVHVLIALARYVCKYRP